MINKPRPFKGLKIRIPFKIPIKAGGVINKGSTLSVTHGSLILRILHVLKDL